MNNIKLTKIYKNKKSSITIVKALITSIIVMIVLLSILHTININTKEIADDEICKTSLFSSQLSQDSILPSCKMNIRVITNEELERKYNMDKYEQLHRNLEYKYYEQSEINTNVFKINKIFADEMANLWGITGEGSANPFNKLENSLLFSRSNIVKYCYVRSYIRFSEDINGLPINYTPLKDDGTKNHDSLFHFLMYNPRSITSDESYYNYLSDKNSPIENYGNVIRPILENDKISKDKEYYIIYRKTYFNENSGGLKLASGTVGLIASSLFRNNIIGTIVKTTSLAVIADGAIDQYSTRLRQEGIDEIILIDSNSLSNDINKKIENQLCTYYIN